MNHWVGSTTLGAGEGQPATRRYDGKYPAIVLDGEPEEDALKRGELLVQVPGILEESEDGEGQQPIEVIARPSFPAGFYFVPEPGTRVWVEFAAGDINSPLWSGVWYPDGAPPQTADDAAPTRAQKIIRTAAGHVVQLDDTDQDEKIVVRHKLDSRITIDAEGHIVIQHKDGMTIEVTANNTINISCDKLTVTADDITLDGAVHITGDLKVGNELSTTISGNEITGG